MPHISELVQTVLFPLLCHTEEQESQWHEDPYEYIRVKHGALTGLLVSHPCHGRDTVAMAVDYVQDFISPESGAKMLLSTLAKHRVCLVGSCLLGEGLTVDCRA